MRVHRTKPKQDNKKTKKQTLDKIHLVVKYYLFFCACVQSYLWLWIRRFVFFFPYSLDFSNNNKVKKKGDYTKTVSNTTQLHYSNNLSREKIKVVVGLIKIEFKIEQEYHILCNIECQIYDVVSMTHFKHLHDYYSAQLHTHRSFEARAQNKKKK